MRISPFFKLQIFIHSFSYFCKVGSHSLLLQENCLNIIMGQPKLLIYYLATFFLQMYSQNDLSNSKMHNYPMSIALVNINGRMQNIDKLLGISQNCVKVNPTLELPCRYHSNWRRGVKLYQVEKSFVYNFYE